MTINTNIYNMGADAINTELVELRAKANWAEAELDRDNKRKKYIKGYQRDNACMDSFKPKGSFKCKVCDQMIVPAGAGSEHRNHCPHCLSSKHLDYVPGDRSADCGGAMEAIGVWVRKGGEWAIIHRCGTCGHLSSNRCAADDNPLMLMSVALRPLGNPPFPLERMEGLAEAVYGPQM